MVKEDIFEFVRRSEELKEKKMIIVNMLRMNVDRKLVYVIVLEE